MPNSKLLEEFEVVEKTHASLQSERVTGLLVFDCAANVHRKPFRAVLKAEVTRVDTQNKRVIAQSLDASLTTDEHMTVSYDKLCVATGAKPKVICLFSFATRALDQSE